jgi:O-antigen/teichoic acid export membrane protein
MSQTATTACDPASAAGRTGRVRAVLATLRSRLLGGGEQAVDRGNAILAFAVRVASAAILFVSQVAIARWMGADQFGAYVYAWTLVLLLGGIASLGLNIGAIRIVSELRERAAHESLRGFLRSSRLFVLLTGTSLAALATGCVWLIAGWPPTGPWLTVAVILVAVPAYALTDLQDGICRGSARIASALLAPYIVRPLLVLGGVGALNAGGLPLDATVAAIIAVAATWIAWGVQTAMVQRDTRRLVPVGQRSYDIRAWASTTAPLAVMSLFDLAMQHIDVVLISNLLSPADAGIYFAGAKTMSLILFVHYAVGSSMANRFAAISTRGDDAAMRAAVHESVRWTFWPSLVLAGVMLAAGQHILALFGPRFVAGYPVMCILAVAVLARAAIGPSEAVLNMTGGQRDCARSLVAAASANVALSLVLTPLFGIIGAAIAVASAMVLGAVLNWRAVRRNLGIDLAIWAAWRRPARTPPSGGSQAGA